MKSMAGTATKVKNLWLDMLETLAENLLLLVC